MHSVARPAAATPQTPGEASAATTPFPTSRELRKVFSVKQLSPVFLTSARCIPKCDVSGCHSCGHGELASGPRGWALPGTRARGACAGRGRLSFFFFSLPFKTEKVMQFEKVQTIRHCRELKFETTPRGAELSRAPPLPCSLPGRAALGPPEPRDRKQRLESRPLPAMALRMPTRAVGKVASGQATSGQVPLPGAPGVRPRPPLAESGPSLPASCSSWALSPSWGLCGESLTPDRPWCSCSQA